MFEYTSHSAIIYWSSVNLKSDISGNGIIKATWRRKIRGHQFVEDDITLEEEKYDRFVEDDITLEEEKYGVINSLGMISQHVRSLA